MQRDSDRWRWWGRASVGALAWLIKALCSSLLRSLPHNNRRSNSEVSSELAFVRAHILSSHIGQASLQSYSQPLQLKPRLRLPIKARVFGSHAPLSVPFELVCRKTLFIAGKGSSETSTSCEKVAT
ncbi:hypothetical protein BDV96DRAFT_567103, partial [Lophiotrema nucula]